MNAQCSGWCCIKKKQALSGYYQRPSSWKKNQLVQIFFSSKLLHDMMICICEQNVYLFTKSHSTFDSKDLKIKNKIKPKSETNT